MLKKKLPQRKCVGCGTSKDKKELIRIVRSPENEISVDKTGKKSGRGAYICANSECLKKAKKTKKLERTLEVTVEDKIYLELEEKIIEIQA